VQIYFKWCAIKGAKARILDKMHLCEMRGMPRRLQPQCLANESEIQIKIENKIKNKNGKSREIKRRHRNNRNAPEEGLKIIQVDRSRRVIFPLLLLLTGLNGLTQVGALKGKCQQMHPQLQLHLRSEKHHLKGYMTNCFLSKSEILCGLI